MNACKLITDPEKEQLLKLAKSCKGKLGLAAVKSGKTLDELKSIIAFDPEIRQKFASERRTFKEAFNDVTDIQLKLHILDGSPWAIAQSLADRSSADNFVNTLSRLINDVQSYIKDNLKTPDYHPEYDDFAYVLLGASPFTTKAHLCEAFQCSNQTLEQWIRANPSFNDRIDQGLAEGEAKARNLLLSASLEPSSKVNTTLLKTLANNVYEIKDEPQTILINNNSLSTVMITDEMSSREASSAYTQMLKET